MIMGSVIPLGKRQEPAASAVAQLRELVGDDLARVNALITARMTSSVAMIPELAGHLVGSGGKRLRPMLTLAAAHMSGYAGQSHIQLAAAVEFMHTATLLHDDVVDGSDLRRGHATARTIRGNKASILVGDFLLGRAFKIMVQARSLAALEILSHAASVIAEGEVMQLAGAGDIGATEDSYLRVIDAKTAELFAAAAEVGAVLADPQTGPREALRSYGRNLGLAFQLVDDALDYGGQAGDMGKNTGGDFREGKITLPVILAFRRGTAAERAAWQRMMKDRTRTGDDLRRAQDMLLRHRALPDTAERARHYGAMAKDALAIFADTPHRAALAGLVDFCITRSH